MHCDNGVHKKENVKLKVVDAYSEKKHCSKINRLANKCTIVWLNLKEYV